MSFNILKSLAIVIMFLIFQNVCYCQIKRHNADYYFQQANIRYQVPPGHYTDSLTKECIVLYSKAIQLNPKFSKAYRNRGRLYSNLKLYKNAISDLTQAIKYGHSDEKWDLYKSRGQYLYSSGDYKKAIADFNLAIPIDGNPAYLYLFRAKAYWKLGLKDRACHDYKIAIKRNPSIAAEREFLDCN